MKYTFPILMWLSVQSPRKDTKILNEEIPQDVLNLIYKFQRDVIYA